MRVLRRGRSPARSRVFLILIDGCHPAVLKREVAAGYLPNFQHLIDHGIANWETVSIFPTSTPAAISSIMTGTGPQNHHIPGMFWWNRRRSEAVYYGESLRLIRSHFARFFEDIIGGLNHLHLNPRVRTIYERLEQRGLCTASLNSLCFRGLHRHSATIPSFLRMIPGVRFTLDAVLGPHYLRFGDFVRSGQIEASFFGADGPFKQFGISDQCTIQAFLQLAQREELPDFVTLYFPDNDVWSHIHGPQSTGIVLRKVDMHLGRVFDVLGGPMRAVANHTFFVIADHAQTPVGTTEESVIDLDTLFEGFTRLALGQPWCDEDVFACPNGRFAQIYLHAKRPWLRSAVLVALGKDERIEHVLWRDGPVCHVFHPYSRSKLEFMRGGKWKDRYGLHWSLRGDLSVLALEPSRNTLHSELYPDALIRIWEALHNESAGDLLCTATTGCEFGGHGEEVHLGGGSHGAFAKEESLVPLIACGRAEEVGAHVRRTTEVAQAIVRALGC